MLNLLLLNQAAQDFEITKSELESRGSSEVCPLLHGTREIGEPAGSWASMAHYGC
jgi:hypothetical protein